MTLFTLVSWLKVPRCPFLKFHLLLNIFFPAMRLKKDILFVFGISYLKNLAEISSWSAITENKISHVLSSGLFNVTCDCCLRNSFF